MSKQADKKLDNLISRLKVMSIHHSFSSGEISITKESIRILERLKDKNRNQWVDQNCMEGGKYIMYNELDRMIEGDSK